MNNTEKKAKIIRETVHTIVEYVRQKEIIAMKEKNNDEYIKHMKSLFVEFEKTQPALFGIAIEGDDLDNMDLILNGLIARSRGTITHDEMEKKVGMGIMQTIMDKNNL